MSLDPWVLAAIAGMTLATYATRAGGYLLFRAMKPSREIRVALGYIPGTLFISYVVPALADGGVQQWVGAAATLAAMLATRQMSLAILAGTGAAWVVWAVASS